MYSNFNDTICAPATIPGTGAISLIRVCGPDTFSIAGKVISVSGTPLPEASGYTIRYGMVTKADGSVLDNVLVSIFRAPHSYTGEDSVEISCHASKYIVNEILQMLINAGARAALPGEFTQRAFMNGKMDLAQAEAVADVISAQNEAAHRAAMNQLKGGFSKELKALRDKLLKMTSLLELELDFSEEDVEFANRDELSALVNGTIAHTTRLADSFSRGNAIKNGIPVAIVGATNTGKSTLLNALLGEDRAIVSDIAGTTRDTIEETYNIGGILFRFIDTAGIRETSETIEKIGIERTMQKLRSASIVLGLVDITKPSDELAEDVTFILDKYLEALAEGGEKHLILVLNKCDVIAGDEADNSGEKEIKVSSVTDGLPRIDDGAMTANSHSGENANISATDDDCGLNYGAFGSNLRSNKNVIVINNIVSLPRYKSIATSFAAISAKEHSGLSTLTEMLSNLGSELTGTSDGTLVTNIRHYEALTNAACCLAKVRDGLGSAIPSDLIAQDLREALSHLGSILGEITTDEVLGNIFKNFCVGK